jgi:hypothetical protein
VTALAAILFIASGVAATLAWLWVGDARRREAGILRVHEDAIEILTTARDTVAVIEERLD